MKNHINKIMIFWQIKSAPEKMRRRIATGFIFIVAIGVMWLYPLLKEREQLSQQLPELRHQLTLAYALTQKISQFADSTTQTPDISAAAIQKNLTTAGLIPHQVRVDNQVIKLEFAKVSFSNLIKWTHDAQIYFHLIVIEANIFPLDQLDQVHAILIFKKLI